MDDHSGAWGFLTAVLLTNPILLVVMVVAGIIALVVGLTIIIVYGLLTAIILFAISGLAIVFLHYLKVIELQKQPIILLVPLVFFMFGFFSERLKIFSINPQPVTGATGNITLYDSSIQLIMLIVVIALIITVVAVLLKKRR